MPVYKIHCHECFWFLLANYSIQSQLSQEAEYKLLICNLLQTTRNNTSSFPAKMQLIPIELIYNLHHTKVNQNFLVLAT